MSEMKEACEHCGSVEVVDYCGACGEFACPSCKGKRADCVIAMRERLAVVEAFLLDADGISIADLRSLATQDFCERLRRDGVAGINETLVSGIVEQSPLTEVREGARRIAPVLRSRLGDRLAGLRTAAHAPTT